MPADFGAHDHIVAVVEKQVREAGHGPELLVEDALKLWRDFAATTDLGRTRKPETWAAALIYAFERMQMGWMTQQEAADVFGVSTLSVSTKYKEIVQAVDLTLLDERYLSEGRRGALMRSIGRPPDDVSVLDAPAFSIQPFSFGFDMEGFTGSPEDLVFDGWDALAAGDVEDAEACFREALGEDPALADAHNGLGHVAEIRDDLEAAAAHHQRAYELARDTLGTEDPEAFPWWLDIDTRPYMRARDGLAWIRWQQGRYREAIEQYEALLRLNPNDNQGARHYVAPLYQLDGDLDGALEAYARYDERYPDDMPEPHFSACRALALHEAGDHEEALRRWHQAIFENVYLVPLLLDEPLPREDVWHGINLAEPHHAEAFIANYDPLWLRNDAAQRLLPRLWHDADVQAAVEHHQDLSHTLHDLAQRSYEGEDRDRWRKLVTERHDLERQPLGDDVLRRVLEEK